MTTDIGKTPCPSWCDVDDHLHSPDDDGRTRVHHQGRIDSLKDLRPQDVAYVGAVVTHDGTIEMPFVALQVEWPGHLALYDPRDVRKLAADLIRGAEIVESYLTGPPCPDCGRPQSPNDTLRWCPCAGEKRVQARKEARARLTSV
jgi:hypothetical protein